jgi:hypothetical protein
MPQSPTRRRENMARGTRVKDYANKRGQVENSPTQSKRGAQIQFYIPENRKLAFKQMCETEGITMTEELINHITDRILAGPKLPPPSIVNPPIRNVQPSGEGKEREGFSIYLDEQGERVIGPVRDRHLSTRVNAVLGRYRRMIDEVGTDVLKKFSKKELEFLSNVSHWNELELSHDLRRDLASAVSDYGARVKGGAVDPKKLIDKLLAIESESELIVLEEHLRNMYLESIDEGE